MSALASGFTDANMVYLIKSPIEGDLNGEPFTGACYYQKADICWIPNRAASVWTVLAINGDSVTIRPNKPRWNGCPINGGKRVISKKTLATEYVKCQFQRQRSPC